MIGVVVADDQHLVREGLQALIRAEPGMGVVAEAATGDGVLTVVDELCDAGTPPDVVVMDVRLPGTDGIEVARRLTTTERWAGTGVVVTTTFEYDDHVLDALEAGARGFVLKDAPPAELLAAVRLVAEGQAALSPRATRFVVDHLASRRDPARAAGDRGALVQRALSHRDRTVLALVASGLTDEEIARRLRVFPVAAAALVQRVSDRLGARTRAELVVVAYESGLVTPARAGR